MTLILDVVDVGREGGGCGGCGACGGHGDPERERLGPAGNKAGDNNPAVDGRDSGSGGNRPVANGDMCREVDMTVGCMRSKGS